MKRKTAKKKDGVDPKVLAPYHRWVAKHFDELVRNHADKYIAVVGSPGSQRETGRDQRGVSPGARTFLSAAMSERFVGRKLSRALNRPTLLRTRMSDKNVRAPVQSE